MFKASRVGLVIITLLSPTITHTEVVTAAIGSLSVKMTIEKIFSELDSIINKARETADYSMMRAAMETKDAIQAWKGANMQLMDTAFSNLDKQQQQIFNNARQIEYRTAVDVEKQLKLAQDITNQVNQSIASIPGNDRTFITNFEPRVILPITKSPITLRIKGVNLDKGNPTLELKGKSAPRMLIGPMEVQYKIDEKALPGVPLNLGTIPLMIKYTEPKDGFLNRLTGKRETVTRELPLITLPTQIGQFSYNVVTTSEKKEIKIWTSQLQLFEGRNTTIRKVVPPLEGWQWDWEQGVKAFKQVSGRGEAGHCNGIIESNSNRFSITHTARVNRIWSTRQYGDGWQYCSLNGPIFKMIKETKIFATQTGVIEWTQDVRLPIPPDTTSITLEVTTFDGRKRIFTDSGADKYFDILRSENQIIIHPIRPFDL